MLMEKYDYLIDYFDFGENDKHGDDDVYINRKSYFIKPILLFESEYLNGE